MSRVVTVSSAAATHTVAPQASAAAPSAALRVIDDERDPTYCKKVLCLMVILLLSINVDRDRFRAGTLIAGRRFGHCSVVDLYNRTRRRRHSHLGQLSPL